jgi:hypothetical protein
MSLTQYDAVVPPLTQILGSLSSILDKAITHAAARKIDPSVLFGYRLAPDMLPLSRQIQIATDQAKGAVARLTGIAVPAYEDNETSLADLQARLTRTLEFIGSATPDQFEGAGTRAIHLSLGGGRELDFTGDRYFFHWVLPNLFFHAVTAYDILRHAGVELGKRDFLGKF